MIKKIMKMVWKNMLLKCCIKSAKLLYYAILFANFLKNSVFLSSCFTFLLSSLMVFCGFILQQYNFPFD